MPCLRELRILSDCLSAATADSAYARSEDRTRALLAGFNNHVSKPVEPMELLAVIGSLSRRARV